MAWQSPSGMVGGNAAGNGGDGNQANQPQGTEYTLQGRGDKYLRDILELGSDVTARGDALPTNRMAPA